MENEELDRILQVVENPVRRRIIKRLSQEPAYALQLSKELGLGQSLVVKHLGIMEEAGLLTNAMAKSNVGPERRLYSLAKGISITMDLGPNLFMEKGTAFEARPRGKHSEHVGRLRERVQRAAEDEDDARKLSVLSEVLGDIDERMEEIDGERTELLGVRNLAMSEAARVASKFEELDKRRVLFHILDEHDREVDRISEALNLREFSVRSILDELRDYLEW
jgi:predicted transcriptional regulator